MKAATSDPVASVYGILKLDRPTDELIVELRGPADDSAPEPARRRSPRVTGRR